MTEPTTIRPNWRTTCVKLWKCPLITHDVVTEAKRMLNCSSFGKVSQGRG